MDCGGQLSLKRRVTDPNTGLVKGTWLPEEDKILQKYVDQHGARNWSYLLLHGLLKRSAKSCRLRYLNHLKPGIYKTAPDGSMSKRLTDEEKWTVMQLQRGLGNKWSKIAAFLPGRTDNDVKNFWNLQRSQLLRELKRTGESVFSKESSLLLIVKKSEESLHNSIQNEGKEQHRIQSHNVDMQEIRSSADSNGQVSSLGEEEQQLLVLPSRKDVYPLHLTRVQMQELGQQLRENDTKEWRYGGICQLNGGEVIPAAGSSFSSSVTGRSSKGAPHINGVFAAFIGRTPSDSISTGSSPSDLQWAPHGTQRPLQRGNMREGRAFLESLIELRRRNGCWPSSPL